jgi:transcriptional regulator with XRE-family HTH domain
MAAINRHETKKSAFGGLLREWRVRRRLSQLTLAVEAEISPRHLGFLELGRARPSADMVQRLSLALDLSLRDQNGLLFAAGYAPRYSESGLEAPAMAQARRALEFMLRQQEPYPALVLDRYWNVVMANEATKRVQEYFLDLRAVAELGPQNAMRLLLHPRAFRPYIVNWEAMAAGLIQWLHREVVNGAGDEPMQRLLDELLSFPGVPQHWRTADLDAATAPFLAIEFRKNDLMLRFFTTLTSFGTPHDVTLQELRIESFFPADERTELSLRRLSKASLRPDARIPIKAARR